MVYILLKLLLCSKAAGFLRQNQTRYDLIMNWIVEFCTTGWYLYATYCVPLSVSSLKSFPGSRLFLILRNLNALFVPWMTHSLAVVHCYYWRTKLELQSASKWLLGAVSVWARSSLVLFSSHQLCADRSENLRILYFILIFYIIFVSFPFFSSPSLCIFLHVSSLVS